MEWYELWLLIGFATLIMDMTGSNEAFNDMFIMAKAHPSKLIAISGLIAIFSFAVLLGPINTAISIHRRYRWRQLKKRFPDEFGD